VLKIDNDVLVRTAIQVLTVLGTDHNINVIKDYTSAENGDIAKDAKWSFFARGIKIKTQKLKQVMQ
jgi:hypothetical protein